MPGTHHLEAILVGFYGGKRLSHIHPNYSDLLDAKPTPTLAQEG